MKKKTLFAIFAIFSMTFILNAQTIKDIGKPKSPSLTKEIPKSKKIEPPGDVSDTVEDGVAKKTDSLPGSTEIKDKKSGFEVPKELDAEKDYNETKTYEEGYAAGYRSGLKESTIVKPETPAEKGTYILKGGISFSKFGPKVSGVSSPTGFSLTIDPELQYFVRDKIAAGGTVEYSYDRDSKGNVARVIGIGPICSYFFIGESTLIPYVSLFGVFRNQFDFVKVSSTMKWAYQQYGIGVKAGVISMISKQAGINFEVRSEFKYYDVARGTNNKASKGFSYEVRAELGLTCFIF